MADVGRVPDGTGLGSADGHSGQTSCPDPSGAIPRACTFINWIADRYQQAHAPPLGRTDAIVMAVHTMEWIEDDVPFADPRFVWDESAAHALADEEISHWETVDG